MNAVSLRKVLYPIEIIMFLVILMLGVFDYLGYMTIYSTVQAKTVMINACFALCIVFIPLILEAFTKKKVSSFLDILICVDLIFSVVLGEACQLYLTLTWWDKMLHVFASAESALLGYVLAKPALNKLAPNSTKTALYAVIFAFFFAIAGQTIWEVIEFACDAIAGTNMQKYLPPEYYYSINADGSLGITVEELIAFYSSEEGYRYALQDTMLDIIIDVVGVALGCVATYLVFRFRPEFQDTVLFIEEKNELTNLLPETENSGNNSDISDMDSSDTDL